VANPKRSCPWARRLVPRLFTAAVTADWDKPGGKSPVGVKSGYRESPGRREWLVIMVVVLVGHVMPDPKTPAPPTRPRAWSSS
jgi:hypothetical protein